MNKKMQSCFTPHAMIHSLTGLGVGIILIQFIPALNSLVVGIVALGLGIVLDMMRKS